VTGMSPEVPTDKCGDAALYSRQFGTNATPSSTGLLPAIVIHNLTASPFWDDAFLRRMPERQLSREPICPCTVAVLVDQEGEQ